MNRKKKDLGCQLLDKLNQVNTIGLTVHDF